MEMTQRQIPTAKIDRNDNNPRGINIVEQDDKLGLLRDSINEFGILVPLVVVPRRGRYILIDGERRYEAAKSLGLKNVPAYVAESELSDRKILVRMFHIHHNREQWGPIPQCNALEDMYKKLKKRKNIRTLSSEDAKIKVIAAEIEQRTGLDAATARDRVLFLRWPENIKKKLYKHPTGAHHHIVEIESRIILPALKNYPEYFQEVPVDDVRRFLFEKIDVNAVGRGIEVRIAAPIVKLKVHKKTEKNKVLKILDDLVKDKNMTYKDAREEFDREFPSATALKPPSPRKLLTAICDLCEMVEMFNLESFSKKGLKRGKATPKEVAKASQNLMDVLMDLLVELTNLKRGRY